MSLPERAQRIRDLVGTARTCIIEIGRELIAARKEIHGEKPWEDWIDAEFSWSERQAAKFIAVAKAFSASLIATNTLTIDASALYALSAPDVPQSARDEAVEAAEDGDRVTLAQADAMIHDALQIERAKFEALVAEMQEQAAEADATEEAPDIAELIQRLCEATGRKRLKPAQLQHLACILGTAITDGAKVYPPSTLEETQQAEEQLRISAPALARWSISWPPPTLTWCSVRCGRFRLTAQGRGRAVCGRGSAGVLVVERHASGDCEHLRFVLR